jgi:hypothetical protein
MKRVSRLIIDASTNGDIEEFRLMQIDGAHRILDSDALRARMLFSYTVPEALLDAAHDLHVLCFRLYPRERYNSEYPPTHVIAHERRGLIELAGAEVLKEALYEFLVAQDP